jgi:hypothetical protein
LLFGCRLSFCCVLGGNESVVPSHRRAGRHQTCILLKRCPTERLHLFR